MITQTRPLIDGLYIKMSVLQCIASDIKYQITMENADADIRCKQGVRVLFLLKPCSHVTSAFAFSSNVKNGISSNKRCYLHLTFAFSRI